MRAVVSDEVGRGEECEVKLTEWDLYPFRCYVTRDGSEISWFAKSEDVEVVTP